MDPIRTRDFRRDDFSREELDALHTNTSTSDALNALRREAGYKKPIAVRGDDKSCREIKADQRSANGLDDQNFGRDLGLEVAAQTLEGTAAGASAAATGAGFFVYTAAKGILAAHAMREALSLASDKEQMHLALAAVLDLPEGFRNVEVGRWNANGAGFHSGAMNIASVAEKDPQAVALLQLHADRGTDAALARASAFTARGGERELLAVLEHEPAVKQQYESDAAFRAGFDAVVWAKQQGKAEDLTTIEAHLHARNARYDAHHVAVRG